jgi:ketosteroid isomerase-like protein
MKLETMSDEERRAMAIDYLKRMDRGDGLLELFDDHAHVYFPKWGLARGRREFERLFGDLGSLFRTLVHDTEYYNYFVSGDTVVLEGTTRGKTRREIAWGPSSSYGGRGCAVMEIRNYKIQRLFIYLDPDYGGEDIARYPWLAADGSRKS